MTAHEKEVKRQMELQIMELWQLTLQRANVSMDEVMQETMLRFCRNNADLLTEAECTQYGEILCPVRKGKGAHEMVSEVSQEQRPMLKELTKLILKRANLTMKGLQEMALHNFYVRNMDKLTKEDKRKYKEVL